jgi:hypothetical protein
MYRYPINYVKLIDLIGITRSGPALTALSRAPSCAWPGCSQPTSRQEQAEQGFQWCTRFSRKVERDTPLGQWAQE